MALALLSSAAMAQQAQAPQGDASAGDDTVLSEVVVTGSRVARSGYNAPTPLTVISTEEIQRAAPANIADYVNTLPQAASTATPRVANGATSFGTNGLNLLNLRALGINRTLVLLDGRRVVPSTNSGAVDINNLPSSLVERVEVVTGGASAAYGSDAVAGVVNFAIDRDFTGIKGSVSGGVTSRHDDETLNADVAFGTPFAGGRGHFLASGEYGYVAGIKGIPDNRGWFQSCHQLTFAASVTPQRLTACGVNLRGVAQGGVITSTQLANTQFGAGGQPLPFVVGSPIDTNFMVGGNVWREGDVTDLDSRVERASLWTRVGYAITDNLDLGLELSYGRSETSNGAAYQRYPGTGATALTVSATNPFLPASIRSQAAALGITTFRYGYSTYDLGVPINAAERETRRGMLSLEGRFGDGWKWDAYYQRGETTTDVHLNNTTNVARFNQAINATTDPATGRIVCASTLTNPTNGCMPLNIFGYGVASQESIRYVKGTADQYLEMNQDVAALTFSGEPFSLPAGAVSVASGVEYRKESIRGTADATSLVNGWFTGNFKPTVGSYHVKEWFGEFVAPLLKDRPLVRSLELNGAVRATDYSLAGSVLTWKAGLTWSPTDELRLRAVRSKDIRAPNLGELFAAGATASNDVIDTTLPSRPTVRFTRVTSGNPDLEPEEALTTSFGIVYQPAWLEGFSASADYYSIAIDGAVTTPGNQEIVDRCARGEQILCNLIVRNGAGTITQINVIPVNVAEQKVRGIDLESSYQWRLGAAGALRVRGLATRLLDFYVFNNNVKTDSLGQNTGATPTWRWLGSVTWSNDRASLSATWRGFSAGVYDTRWTSGVEIDDNTIGGADYVDLSGDLKLGSATSDAGWRVFFKIENLLDKDPAIVANPVLSAPQINPQLYDVIGRNYRLGVRFRY